MVGKKLKVKSVIGVACQSADGNLWIWQIGGRFYRWCKLGFLELVEDMTVTRVMYSKSMDGAVGYSAGFADGFALGRGVQHIDPATIGRLETKEGETSPSQHGE